MRAFAEEFGETHSESRAARGRVDAARPPDRAAPHAAESEKTLTVAPGDSRADVRPTGAARDRARLLVQSPHRLFFYWSFARDLRPALRAALGEAAGKFRPAVRLVEAGGVWEGEPSAAGDDENSFWFDALPGRAYRAEFGFHAAGLPFVRVLSSNAAETPAAGVSEESDPAPEFGIGGREFARVLEASGYEHARRRASSDALAARPCAPDDSEFPASSPSATPPARRSDIF